MDELNARSWAWNRLYIYERDRGICDVCLQPTSFDEYECGHIVDNLVCMCVLCNRLVKELHETKEQYETWKATRPHDAVFTKLVERIINDLGDLDAAVTALNNLNERHTTPRDTRVG